jgi:hypothetical protein
MSLPSSFKQIAFTSMTASNVSSTIAVPAGAATATALMVVNYGSAPAAVLLGADNTIIATQSNGTVVLPGRSVVLDLNSAAYVAAVGLGMGNAQLNLSFGA